MARGNVILLHGLLGSAVHMELLAARLRAEGYKVCNVDYPSRKGELATLANNIHPQIAQFMEANPEGDVHFVGHSLGGLMIRHYLDQHPCARIGRVMMLGTPNRGSATADRLVNSRLAPFARGVVGPVGDQLLTDFAHPPLRQGEASVIAGNLSFNPLSWIRREAGDGLVPVESTRLDTPHAHTVLRVEHITMPLDPRVMERVVRMLNTGHFEERGGAAR